MTNKIIQHAYDILGDSYNKNAVAKGFRYFIIALIITNVVVVIIESEKEIYDKYHYIFFYFEIFSITIFLVEYVGRIISCKLNPKYKNDKYGRLKFFVTPLMLIDLAAILPFFMTFLFPTIDLRMIRIIRLLRLFKMFGLTRYTESMNMFGAVIKSKSSDLAVAFFILFITLIFASSLMYNAEHVVQPEIFSSIPKAMWWGVITLSTIGYGDVYPITMAGKIIAAVVAILGIAVYAIPSGIMASAFMDELKRRRENKSDKCPHCGKDIHKK